MSNIVSMMERWPPPTRKRLVMALLAALMVGPPGLAQPRATVPDMKPRIVGGHDVDDGQNPFVVALRDAQGRFHCGASLVAPTLLMTAAHCIGVINKDGSAAVGRTLLSSGGKVHRFRSIFVHPEFGEPVRGANDLAFIELAEPVVGIEPIAVPNFYEVDTFAGLEATVSGWGRISEFGEGPERLQEVDLDIETAERCEQFYEDRFDSLRMICAARPRKDACSGDSGGPLFVKADAWSAAVQVGVVSFGDSCGVAPGVYTRLDSKEVWSGLGNSADAQRVRALLGR